jgi:hypothetical protein
MSLPVPDVRDEVISMYGHLAVIDWFIMGVYFAFVLASATHCVAT